MLSSSQSSQPASGRGASAFASSSSSKASILAAGGRCSRVTSWFLEFLQRGKLDGGSSLLWLPHSIPPPSICALRTSGVPFLRLGVCTSSGTSGGSEQDASERCLGDARQCGSGILQPSFSDPEGDRWVASGNQPVGLELVCQLDSVLHGDGVFGPGVDLMRGYHVLDWSQWRLIPDSQPYLRFAVFRPGYQFKDLCFGLLSAPQVFTRVFNLVFEWAHRRGSGSFTAWRIG